MVFKPGHQLSKGKGRPVGSQNPDTAMARRAIADFVDNNSVKLQGWLDKIAEGEKDAEDKEYIIKPNPEKAFNLYQSVIEYHIPKLARTELAADKNNPLTVNIVYPQ